MSLPFDEKGVMAPAAFGSVRGASRPQISTGPRRDADLRIRVRHREYVQDITGSVAFALQQLNINPGLASLFPWLSNLAALFESYQFNSLTFQFRTEGGTAQAGKILLAVDWDVLDNPPATKQAMMQERTKADAQTWVNFDLVCDLRDLLKFGVQRYIRNGAAPSVSDLKTYDVGMFNLATQGVTGAPVVGELWVEYDVELITPNTAPLLLTTERFSGATPTSASIVGAAPVITGGALVTVSGNVVTFLAAGKYFVHCCRMPLPSRSQPTLRSVRVAALRPIWELLTLRTLAMAPQSVRRPSLAICLRGGRQHSTTQ